MNSYTTTLSRNIWKYYALRIFGKRAYLPLIAIYAVSVAKITLYDIGIIAAITSATQLILEIPSGYIADKIGHKRALMLGAVLTTISPLAYVILPNFMGIMLGSSIFFAGVSFYSGTIEAFIHETLLELKREKETAKIMSMAQTIGLIGNAVLIALVPLTYSIDPRLPFVIGAILLGINFIITTTLTSPIKAREDVQELEHLSFKRLMQAFRASNHHILFTLIGITTALSHSLYEFRELYFQDLGIPIETFGFILALTSILGAILSYNIHKLKKWKASTFYLLDFIFYAVLTICLGFATHPIIGIILFISLSAYGRSRKILIHAYVLDDCPTRKLKATYMSLLSFSGALNTIWAPLLLGYSMGRLGISMGYTTSGIIMSIIFSVVYVIYRYRQKNTQEKTPIV